MKNFKFKINGNQYEVEIHSVEGNMAQVEVNGSMYQVEIDKELQVTKTPKLVRPVSVPSTDTPRIQESHILLGHIICQLVEENYFGQSA